MYFKITYQQKGFDSKPIVKEFKSRQEAYDYLRSKRCVHSFIQKAFKEGEAETASDFIKVERVLVNKYKDRKSTRTVGNSRSRLEMLGINAQILATLVAKHPNSVNKADLLDEFAVEVSVRSLDRYVADWKKTGFVECEKGGEIYLSKLGEQSFILQAQLKDGRYPNSKVA